MPEGAWRLRKAKSLVKLLALAPDRRVHRERATELLWPDRGRDAAANNFHQALYVARRALEAAGADGAAVLALRDDMLVLCPGGRVEVDVDAFDAAVARARETGAVADLPRGARAPRRRAAAGGPLRAVGVRPAGGAERGAPGAPARPRRPAGRGRRGRGGDRGARAGGRARPAARGRPPRAHAPVRRGGAPPAGAPAVPAPARGAPARARGRARPADRRALPRAAARRRRRRRDAGRRRTPRAPAPHADAPRPPRRPATTSRPRSRASSAASGSCARSPACSSATGCSRSPAPAARARRASRSRRRRRAPARCPTASGSWSWPGWATPALVPAATASALGLTLPSQRPALDGLGAQLAGWRGAARPRQLRAPRRRPARSSPSGCSAPPRACGSSPRAASRCGSPGR